MTLTSQHNQFEVEQISALIERFEEMHGVEVIFAAEQGSRAWGLSHALSDYDVRMIYKEPPERAFALFRGGDVLREEMSIETPSGRLDVDLSGWSLQKSLQLAAASNPQLNEMARAPVLYRAESRFHEDLMTLAAAASPRIMAHYYRGTAKKTLLGRISDAPQRDVKSLIQMTRGMLSSLWFVQNPTPGGFPPLRFEDLCNSVDLSDRSLELSSLSKEMDRLVQMKLSGAPRKTEERFTFVEQWGLSEMEALDKDVMTVPDHELDRELVEAIFRRQYPEAFAVDEEDELLPAEF